MTDVIHGSPLVATLTATAAHLGVAAPCDHNVPLQREPLGDHVANFCPTCRAVETERERAAKIADDLRRELRPIGGGTGPSCCLEIAARIRIGE